MKKNNLSETVRMNLRTHIDAYKKRFKISQDRLAVEKMNMDPTLLSKKLNGKTAISLADVDDYSRALGVSRYELIGSEEAPDANVTLISDKIADLSPEQRANALQILDLFCESVKKAS